jgi:DNA topoisomerase-1
VSPGGPGIRRRRAGKGFVYLDADGEPVTSSDELARFRALAIPPAWTDVWICPNANGHIQAIGRDARGRRQYRYHPGFRERRDRGKFTRIIHFAERLPRIRRRVRADLGLAGLPRDKVLAAVVTLLELTHLRVGNRQYARLNRSFGLSTLRDQHVRIEGAKVRFRFKGKGGRTEERELVDRQLASIVRRCQALPGQDLFQYVDDDGETRIVRSEDVNAYLREITGEADITAKDFRTWAGTVLTYRALRALQPGATDREARRNVVEAIRQTAGVLGNTPTVCRASYVHPAVLEAYVDGRIDAAEVADDTTQVAAAAQTAPEEEQAVVELLRERLEADAGRGRKRPQGRR